MKKIVYIERDDYNAIVISRDHYHGVAIQVIRFVDQLSPIGPNNELSNIKNQRVVHQILVKIEPGKDTFKDEVYKAVMLAKEKLAEIKIQDRLISGVLNDYSSIRKDLNQDEQR